MVNKLKIRNSEDCNVKPKQESLRYPKCYIQMMLTNDEDQGMRLLTKYLQKMSNIKTNSKQLQWNHLF